jgi:hypothetical protein
LVSVTAAASANKTEKTKNQDIALQSILANKPCIRANLTDIYPFEFTQKKDKDERQPCSFHVGDAVIVRRTENSSSGGGNRVSPAASPYLPSSLTVANGYYLPCT